MTAHLARTPVTGLSVACVRLSLACRSPVHACHTPVGSQASCLWSRILVNYFMIRTALSSLLFLWAVSLNAQSSGSPNLAPGDACFVQMQYPEAVRDYESLLTNFPGDPALLWRLSRVYVCLGEVDENAQTRVATMRKAETYARMCIANDARSPEGHTWLGAALGYLALDAGLQDQVSLSRELLHETDLALSLNPRNDAALSIRGSFFRALGNVGWFKRQMAGLFLGEIPDGGFPEAEMALREAIALAPDIMRHQYELGVLYMDMDRIPEACEAFERASHLQVRVAIDRPRLAKTKAFLAGLQCNGEKEK
jgi:tetratricopeptide (TPR) repeat protein